MSAAKTRKSLSSTVKKKIEDKNNVVNKVISHIHPITTEQHNAIIPEKEKATFYINKQKLEVLEDVSYKLRKLYPEKKKKINKSTILEIGLDLVFEICDDNIKSDKIFSYINNIKSN
jgi:hypothetical protein